ncbi:MAG: D-alanyl-D-alanine carboxypeptidase/D-alanyl-D-alanine-endopeptidase [Gammaproteobacteria bacterium]|nr:D-alanyl-D-alanine carboxypeptidase/D-alanyl-D-alanine-endopeptidase [Gammaproteobacteria bacterium]
MRHVLVVTACLGPVLFAAPALHAQPAGLPETVQRVMSSHRLPESSLGIVVQEAGADMPLLSVNAGVPRNPASTIKIITTLAALEELGPAYVWPTEVYVLGSVRGGTLDGDLGFKGFGDPYLVVEEFWKLLQAVRRQGITRINGDLVIDNSYFTVPDEDPGAFDNRPSHTYNALPDAFLVNFRSVNFHFYPSTNGRSVEIRLDPELPNLAVENRLKTSAGRCGGFQRGISIDIPQPARGDRVIFHGNFPASCGYYVLGRSVLTPQTYAFGMFKFLWEQSGGSISGGVRSVAGFSHSRHILNWRSRPLGEVIRLVNKFSNNVMTRNLLLTLGAERHGEPGTVEKGIQAIEEYLHQHGIRADSMRMINGAGLSRDERVSPRLLADVLLYAHSIPYMPEFVSSLSIVGVDGSARNRFSARREAGRAHIKTGTIDHVSAVAGYVHAESGRNFVIAGIINHNSVHQGPGEHLWNALIRWTYQQ